MFAVSLDYKSITIIYCSMSDNRWFIVCLCKVKYVVHIKLTSKEAKIKRMALIPEIFIKKM